MIGIYKYTNKTNNKVYIGQSVDIERRVYMHKISAQNEEYNEYNSQFHQAIRKYGYDNFDFEVIVELSDKIEDVKEVLNLLEQFFIKKYNSFHKGYNATEGGVSVNAEKTKGENNGRALLTEEEVKDIRIKYNNHIPFRFVYEEYQNKISKRGLQKIWYFETWKDIYPEFNNEENKHFHAHQAKANSSEVASNNKRYFSNDEVYKMRELYYLENKSFKDIHKEYGPQKAASTIRNAIVGKTYKEVPMPVSTIPGETGSTSTIDT